MILELTDSQARVAHAVFLAHISLVLSRDLLSAKTSQDWSALLDLESLKLSLETLMFSDG